MNPRDEKILLAIKRKQKSDYGNLVPFCIIQKTFLWIDATELTSDLLSLTENGYLWKVDDPSSEATGWWYGLTSLGKRECERIKYDSVERKKNRKIQLVSSCIGAIIGYIVKSVLG